jgi:hypothetical protein
MTVFRIPMTAKGNRERSLSGQQESSKTPAIKRFTIADDKGMEHHRDNQRNWKDLAMDVREINQRDMQPKRK